MKSPLIPRVVFPAICAVAAWSASVAHASLIVYEGFDYGASSGSLGGLGAGAGIGLQGTWTVNGTAGTTVDYQPLGLTFSDLPVTGGLTQLNGVITGTGDRTAAAFRQLDVLGQSGTLWGSYLFRKTSDATTRSVVTLLQGNLSTISDNTAYFSLANNEFNQSVGGVRVSAGSGGNAGLVSVTAPAPALNTTYLYLFKLENVGAASGSTQSATMWMLSEAQYDHFKLDGLDEAELNAASLGTLDSNVFERVSLTTTNGLTSPGTFDATDFLRFYNFGGAEIITQFDEIKFSNGSLNEAVTSVPEPSAALACLGGVAMLLGIRRLRGVC